MSFLFGCFELNDTNQKCLKTEDIINNLIVYSYHFLIFADLEHLAN